MPVRVRPRRLPLPHPAAAHAGIQIVLAAALCVLLQALADRHSTRLDTTPTRLFVLSSRAQEVAAHLSVAARLTAFYDSRQPGARRDLLDLLERFARATPTFTFRLFDLDRTPGLAKRYGVTAYNSGVLEAGARTVALRALDEASLTAGLIKLSPAARRTICFLTGHGERDPTNSDEREGYSAFARALDQDNFAVRTLDRLPAAGVPSDCAVVVAAGPSRNFDPGESERLAGFLRTGGRALVLADPDAPAALVEFLGRFAIDVGGDLIVDEQSRFLGWDSFVPHVVQFNPAFFGRTLATEAVFAVARTVHAADAGEPGLQATAIAATGPDSWALVDGGRTPDTVVAFRKGVDHPGPLSVGVLATVAAARPGQLAVFGDSDFASNRYFNLLGNRDLALATIAALADEPPLAAARSAGTTADRESPITLTAAQSRTIFWTVVVTPPLLCLALGATLALRRRRQHGGR